MTTSDWEEIRENVMKSFQDGKKDGKDYVEVATGLLWFERQRSHFLCVALEEILRVARVALDAERSASSRPSNLLQMVIDPGTGLPCRHQIECTLVWDGPSHPLQEVQELEAAGKDCTSDLGQYACRDITKV
jgi:hypothetical protein